MGALIVLSGEDRREMWDVRSLRELGRGTQPPPRFCAVVVQSGEVVDWGIH